MPVNPGAVKDKGGNVIAIMKASDIGVLATVTPGTTALHLGLIADSSVKQTANKTDYKSEDGKTQASDFEYDLITEGTLMQSDKAIIDFLGHTVKGNYYIQYKYQGIKDGKHQEVFTFGSVTPQFDMTTPGGASSNKYQHTGIINTSAITLTGTQLGTIESGLGITIFCTGVTITAGKGWEIKETTVS